MSVVAAIALAAACTGQTTNPTAPTTTDFELMLVNFHEGQFLRNVVDSLKPKGELIIGMPSLQSQTYASPISKAGIIASFLRKTPSE